MYIVYRDKILTGVTSRYTIYTKSPVTPSCKRADDTCVYLTQGHESVELLPPDAISDTVVEGTLSEQIELRFD